MKFFRAIHRNPFWLYAITTIFVAAYLLLLVLSPPIEQETHVFYLPVLLVPFIGVAVTLGAAGFGLAAYRVGRRTGRYAVAVLVFLAPVVVMIGLIFVIAANIIAGSVEHGETFQQDGDTYRIAYPYSGGPGVLYQCEGVFDLYCAVVERGGD
jgi:hypothetical protein